MINDAETTVRFPGRDDVDQRLRVEIQPASLPPLVLYFESPAAAAFVGLEIGSPFHDRELAPATVRRIASQLDLLVKYARATVAWNRDDSVEALRMLKAIGATKRGMPREFFAGIANEYRARLAAGEQHIVKAIAEAHSVTPSAASRWLKSARGHGYLKEEQDA